MVKKIIFVYNAKSILTAPIDAIHKVVSPSTYQCSLCSLTYGVISMKKEWKKLINSLRSKYKIEFLHIKGYEKRYNYKTNYPVVLVKDKETKTLISTKELNSFKTLKELIDKIKKRV